MRFVLAGLIGIAVRNKLRCSSARFGENLWHGLSTAEGRRSGKETRRCDGASEQIHKIGL